MQNVQSNFGAKRSILINNLQILALGIRKKKKNTQELSTIKESVQAF